ncbi:hypothetical protein [Bradyrhizobium elkanii]
MAEDLAAKYPDDPFIYMYLKATDPEVQRLAKQRADRQKRIEDKRTDTGL